MKQSKNPAASVRARLLAIAQKRGEPFEAVMIRYALERLLFRLGRTPHGDDFLLKGGLLLSILSQSPYRQTRDLDLLGRGSPDPQRLIDIFKAACHLDFPEDGLTFAESITTHPIKEDQDYPGVRVLLTAFLDKARLVLQIDIGFGDAVLKPYNKAAFDTLLGFPLPEIYAYPLESVLAEKIHAMISRGLSTSRMKDIYDLWYLASTHSWSSQRIAEAVQLTFVGRQTPLPADLPVMFMPDFYKDPSKLAQWDSFSKTIHQSQVGSLSALLLQLQDFWWPLLLALQQSHRFNFTWQPDTWSWK